MVNENDITLDELKKAKKIFDFKEHWISSSFSKGAFTYSFDGSYCAVSWSPKDHPHNTDVVNKYLISLGFEVKKMI